MSDELRRALADAAGTPPPVEDWLAPVHRGVRLRRRRRALQQAGAGTVLAVAAGLLGAGLLPSREGDVLLPPPATPRPSTSASALPTPPASVPPTPFPTTGPPTTGPLVGLPVRPTPTGGAVALPRLTPRAGSPAAPPVGLPRASAAPARPAPSGPTASRPAPTPTPAPTRAPSPAPTAGAQEVEVSVSPPGRTFPAGEEVVLTVTATGSAERPPDVLSLRLDGEPVEADPPRSCDRPTSAPPRSAQRTERRFTVVLSPGEHLLEAVADDGCSWYRGRGRVSYTVTAS